VPSVEATVRADVLPEASGSLTLPVLAPIAITPTEPSKTPQASVETKLTEFRFVEGSSNKFWRVGVNNCDLIVEFGRVGTRGQRVVKTFDDEERAKREAVKLTLEKTRKGYQEVG
jgi:predicted DNA-binding WGR domain protein